MHETTSPASPGTAPPGAGDTVAHRWAQTPTCVGQARRTLRETLGRWDLADLADDSALVLSELLTNAIEHADNPDRTVGTCFRRLPGKGGVRIEVLDADSGRLPRVPDPAGGEDVRGRGLRLVELCTAQRWGIVLGATGKSVWGEVAR
ncbi:ATP-binding protein [Streptomyces sp. NRRL F-5123]|uniref:ATP-binding protein n=1 Tax=Streptomyces sp. NRRL F-5123 TaxID=1463856 RepID=UPI000693F14E|nr:ATP-binding protein [Streptomyces sp. NRRL F-5123]